MNKTEIKSVPIAELRNLWCELERDRRDHVRLVGKYRQHNSQPQRAEYYTHYATATALANAQRRLKRTVEDHAIAMLTAKADKIATTAKAKAIKEAEAREKATSANAA
jgi:hypothetical protein